MCIGTRNGDVTWERVNEVTELAGEYLDCVSGGPGGVAGLEGNDALTASVTDIGGQGGVLSQTLYSARSVVLELEKHSKTIKSYQYRDRVRFQPGSVGLGFYQAGSLRSSRFVATPFKVADPRALSVEDAWRPLGL